MGRTIFTKTRFFHFCLQNSLSHHLSSSLNNSDVKKICLIALVVNQKHFNVFETSWTSGHSNCSHESSCASQLAVISISIMFLHTRTVILSFGNFQPEHFSFLNERFLVGVSLKEEATLICVKNIIVCISLSNFRSYIIQAILNTIIIDSFFFIIYFEKCYAVTCLKLIYSTVETNKIFVPKQLGKLFCICHERWTIDWYIHSSLLFKLFQQYPIKDLTIWLLRKSY